MRKSIILVIALIVSTITFAQEEQQARDYTVLKGLSFGVGLPIECRDLPGMGVTANIGFDRTWRVKDNFGLGFYLTAGGGLWSEFQRYSDVDNEHVVFRLAAGLMMQIGDLKNKPFLLGVAPGTGFGLYDLDVVLPVEVRFGKYITDRWYLMGELTYHVTLADETACIEPAIRAGYNFGNKPKSKKK